MRFHGLQSPAYYRRAVGSILGSIDGSATVIVTSDDPSWVARELRFDVPTVHAELEAPLSTVDSLALMSRCDHHVISNSSFSWWGAWLASSAGQQVIYPQNWLVDRAVDAAFRFPSTWRAFAGEGSPA